MMSGKGGAGYDLVAGADALDEVELEPRGARRDRRYDGAKEEKDEGDAGDAGDADDADDADETRGFLATGSGSARLDAEAAGGPTSSSPPFAPLGLGAHHRPGEDAPSPWPLSRRMARVVAVSFVTCLAVCIGFKFVADNTGLVLSLGHAAGSPGSGAKGAAGEDDDAGCRTATTVPQHFQTTPQLWPGPTQTGRPAFLAQTVTIDPTATYMANQPLQTNIAVEGMGRGDGSIFDHMGYLSPYHPAPGFGVQEYALPPGAEIVQLQVRIVEGGRGSSYPRCRARHANE